jgi:cell wall-associated NlpC family hydrolase
VPPPPAARGRVRAVASPRRDLRPGDLVFFDGLGHVGIYAGDGRYIHAPQTGDVVRVDRLAARPLDGAVRIAGT